MGFKLTISQNPGGAYSAGNGDRPLFALENMSDPGLEITRIDFTIGDPGYNFDRATLSGTSASGITLGAPAGGSMSIFGSTIDAANGGIRSDEFSLAFTDFGVGESARWLMELDKDGVPANNVANFRNVFFDNGASIENSVMKVYFSDTRVLTYSIAGVADGQVQYSFSQSQDDFGGPATVPLPAALPLMVAGIAGLGIASRRRAKA